MADTFTTNLVLTKPEIGASTDTWGTKLNANSDTIANMFSAGPALKVANGGTGATTAANARTNLGLGTLATQDSSNVSISGGAATLVQVEVAATSPYVVFNETDAATLNRKWAWTAAGQSLYLQIANDDFSSTANVISVSRSGVTPGIVNITATLQVSGNVAYHSGNISTATINESQVADGSVFPRLGSAETITGTWSFTAVPQKTSGGKFLHYASATYNGGAVTVSTSDPSGTPADGDRWVKYVP